MSEKTEVSPKPAIPLREDTATHGVRKGGVVEASSFATPVRTDADDKWISEFMTLATVVGNNLRKS
jgi:hypothetical protein